LGSRLSGLVSCLFSIVLAIMAPSRQPANHQFPTAIHFHHMPRSNMLSQGLPRSGLVQQKTTPNPQEDSKQ
jgi:hypothetical protein